MVTRCGGQTISSHDGDENDFIAINVDSKI